MARWLLVTLLLAGCHGGGHGALPITPGSPDGEAPPSAMADAAAKPDDAAAKPDDAAAGDDATVLSDAATADAAALAADTTWKACGNLAAEFKDLAQSRDGKWLALSYNDGRVTIVDQTTMTVAGRIDTGTRTGAGKLAFTEDGGTLLTADVMGVRLWSVPAGTFQRTLGVSPGGTSLQVSGGPMPLVLVAGTSVPSLRVWRLDGPMLPVTSDGQVAAFTDGGQAIVVVDEAHMAIITLGLDGKQLRRFPLLNSGMATLSPDGGLVATVVYEDTTQKVELYSTRTGKRLWRSVGGVARTRQVAFLGDARLVQLAEPGNDSPIHEVASGKTLGTLPYRQAFLIDPSADGSALAVVTGAGRLARVSVSDGAVRPGPASEFGLTDRILGIDVTRDGRYLAAAGARSTWILDLQENTLARTLEVPGFKPSFSPDGARLAMGGFRRGIYRVADDQPAITIDAADAGPCLPSLVFSPDGQTLASGTCGKVELFRPDGTRLGEHPSQAVPAGVAWSPDGHLATTGPELWPASGNSPVWPAMVPPAPDNGEVKPTDNVVAVSPDGSLMLVSRSTGFLNYADWTTRTDLVRASDGMVIRSLAGRLGRRPSFSADGSWVVAGGYTFHVGSELNRAITTDRASSRFLPDNRVVAIGSERVLRVYCPMRP